jgi:hypothetical protein
MRSYRHFFLEGSNRGACGEQKIDAGLLYHEYNVAQKNVADKSMLSRKKGNQMR